MAKLATRRESRAALSAEWRRGRRLQLDVANEFDIALNDEWRDALAAEIEMRIKSARRDSADRRLGPPREVAAHLLASVSEILNAAGVLYTSAQRSAPIRKKAQAQQVSELAKFQSRVARLLETEIRRAPTGELSRALRSARALIIEAGAAEEASAKARPTRAVRAPNQSAICLIEATAWWWIDQGWEPSTHDDGCFAVVTQRLEETRRGRPFGGHARRTLRAAIRRAAKMRDEGDFPRLIERTKPTSKPTQ